MNVVSMDTIRTKQEIISDLFGVVSYQSLRFKTRVEHERTLINKQVLEREE